MARECTQLPTCGTQSLIDFLRQLAECVVIADGTGLQSINMVVDDSSANDVPVYACDGIPTTAWEAVLNGCFVTDTHGHKALAVVTSQCSESGPL